MPAPVANMSVDAKNLSFYEAVRSCMLGYAVSRQKNKLHIRVDDEKKLVAWLAKTEARTSECHKWFMRLPEALAKFGFKDLAHGTGHFPASPEQELHVVAPRAVEPLQALQHLCGKWDNLQRVTYSAGELEHARGKIETENQKRFRDTVKQHFLSCAKDLGAASLPVIVVPESRYVIWRTGLGNAETRLSSWFMGLPDHLAANGFPNFFCLETSYRAAMLDVSLQVAAKKDTEAEKVQGWYRANQLKLSELRYTQAELDGEGSQEAQA
jgi:hypothetical protein